MGNAERRGEEKRGPINFHRVLTAQWWTLGWWARGPGPRTQPGGKFKDYPPAWDIKGPRGGKRGPSISLSFISSPSSVHSSHPPSHQPTSQKEVAVEDVDSSL